MGVQKITTLSYGVTISYNEFMKFALDNIEGTSPSDWFESIEMWFDDILELNFMEYSDGPIDGDENIYLGIIKEIDCDDDNDGVFKLEPQAIIDEYNSIFTSEIKSKLFPLFENKIEEFLIRVTYR